jgi:hypothetical protein
LGNRNNNNIKLIIKLNDAIFGSTPFSLLLRPYFDEDEHNDGYQHDKEELNTDNITPTQLMKVNLQCIAVAALLNNLIKRDEEEIKFPIKTTTTIEEIKNNKTNGDNMSVLMAFLEHLQERKVIQFYLLIYFNSIYIKKYIYIYIYLYIYIYNRAFT